LNKKHIISQVKQQVRSLLLSSINQRKLKINLTQKLDSARIPVFLVFVPELVHLAPFQVNALSSEYETIFLLNGVSLEDEEWLRDQFPEIIIQRLITSLRKNEKSILGHANVIDDLFSVFQKPFCIQDPDCFITDPSFFDRLGLDIESEFAAGPFTKKPTNHGHALPDTFFLKLNPTIFKKISRKYLISARPVTTLPEKALQTASLLGYVQGEFPEQFKGYFDTLQAFWVLALCESYRFRKVPGAGRSIFHIGGSSYLHRSDISLDHWDYWPLSVQYFNLRLLEMPQNVRFRSRFTKLFSDYGSSGALLEMYPEFNYGRRFAECEKIFESFT